MPQTHPQYQLTYNPAARLDAEPFASCENAQLDGTLGVVAQRAQQLNRGGGMIGSCYTVDPVAGTEPRYRALNIDPEAAGGMPFTSTCTPEPLTWREVCAVWHNAMLAARSGRGFVYRVVQA